MPSSPTLPLRRRWPLSLVLAGFSAILVLTAAMAISAVASLLLRRLAEEQAVQHVELAARAAREMVNRFEDETLAAAHVLAERPTLERLVREEDRPALALFLSQFCAPGGHDGCAVAVDGELLAGAPGDFRPVAVPTAGLEVERSEDGVLRVLARAELPNGTGYALVARDLDAALAEALSSHVGMPVRILPQPAPPEAPPDAWPGEGPAYRAVLALSERRADDGTRLEVALPAEAIGRSLRTLQGTLLAATALVALIAMAGAVAVSRWVARPLHELAASARRIGAGDLATSVRGQPGEEAGRLASTMEEMRRRLLGLTADLRRSESEAQALLGGIVEGVFAVDENRRIKYLNPQAAALLGVDPAAAIGRFCGDVLRPVPSDGERPCESRCPIVHARSRGSTRATEVLQLPGGQRRTVVITSSTPAGGGQVQVMRDETEIESARRARDAVVANVSHEFRTPLSAQLASLELLRGRMEALYDNGTPFDAGSAGLVRSLERSSLRLLHLVDNLLESVRVESGEDSIRRRPVPLDEVVDEAVELMAPILQQRDQAVVVELPHPAPPLHGDAQRITQALVNLLANASKYAPEATTVRIGASREEGLLLIWVEDEGPGLPSGSEGSVFDRFYRAGEPDTGGMGLGLWIVKSIVERHGGEVHARTLGRGGSRFTLTLPTFEAE